jgi:O-antigen/teichoic acid export membrane protein
LREKSTKRKAINASLFTLFGFGMSQIIRLANNMILTRLLVPEYFGIVSIANVFIVGINLFSDIGLGPSLIRSDKTDDETFINTVWTIQVLRGIALTIVALILAYPVALFYGEPKLKAMIIFIGSFSLIEGFNSVKPTLYSKDLRLGALTSINLVNQLISSLAGIGIAYYYRTIWALVFTALISSILELLSSHLILKGEIKPRFHLEKQYISEILHFGKWIFFATAMSFIAGQVDKILLGKLLSFASLGIFNIALMFSELVKQVLERLSGMVLFPLFSKYKNLPRAEFKEKIKKPRRLLLAMTGLLVAILASFGDYLILFLYDERYHAAAWMLPILALGMWPYALYISNSHSLYVLGKAHYHAYGNLLKFVYMIAVLPIAYKLFGSIGVIIAIALNDIPPFLVLNRGYIKERISLLVDDLVFTVYLVLLLVFFVLIRFLFHWGLPCGQYLF